MDVDDFGWPVALIAQLGAPFSVLGPPELQQHVRQAAQLFANADRS
jgi:hypothetical protein